ncbi:hypothetical protein LP7551_02402 [Roseibium album]|nr:hypothetical protein LP7551_02402 [Roseibium album]
MPQNIQFTLGDYLPEHVQPECSEHVNLKDAVDAADLTEMWNMILTLDYSVADPEELSPERRDEFLNVMSLLLKAFDR